jgi:hypothetical protein
LQICEQDSDIGQELIKTLKHLGHAGHVILTNALSAQQSDTFLVEMLNLLAKVCRGSAKANPTLRALDILPAIVLYVSAWKLLNHSS